MKKYLMVLLWLIVLALPWGIAALPVYQKEQVLALGQDYLLEIGGVDPLDYMRGRYVRIRPVINNVQTDVDFDTYVYQNHPIYLQLKADKDGVAQIDHIGLTPSEYTLKIDADNWRRNDSHRVAFTLPLRRFYMAEQDAIDWDKFVTNQNVTHIQIKIYHQDMVAVDLWVDNQPFQTWLAQKRANVQASSNSENP